MTDVIVRAGVPEMDDCKVLTRLKAFVVEQGQRAIVEHVFRDRVGNPVDLSAYVPDAVSSSSVSSASVSSPTGRVRVRVKEFLGVQTLGSARNPIWELDEVSAYDATVGTLRATLEPSLVEHAGIYEMNWAVCDSDGNPVLVDRSLLSVERSLFPVFLDTAYRDLGPPTLQEVRMRLMDSSRSENLLLDDIEFKDDQILLALAEPVRFWNEAPPPIRQFTTRDFPFRGAWVSGILAQLYLAAANHYRRNRLAHTAGGISVDDKDKERDYTGEGQRLWTEYTDWVYRKKVEINMKYFSGNVRSIYSSLSGW